MNYLEQLAQWLSGATEDKGLPQGFLDQRAERRPVMRARTQEDRDRDARAFGSKLSVPTGLEKPLPIETPHGKLWSFFEAVTDPGEWDRGGAGALEAVAFPVGQTVFRGMQKAVDKFAPGLDKLIHFAEPPAHANAFATGGTGIVSPAHLDAPNAIDLTPSQVGWRSMDPAAQAASRDLSAISPHIPPELKDEFLRARQAWSSADPDTQWQGRADMTRVLVDKLLTANPNALTGAGKSGFHYLDGVAPSWAVPDPNQVINAITKERGVGNIPGPLSPTTPTAAPRGAKVIAREMAMARQAGDSRKVEQLQEEIKGLQLSAQQAPPPSQVATAPPQQTPRRGLYSPFEKMKDRLPASGSVPTAQAQKLAGDAGVTADEQQFTGFPEWLAQKQGITRADLDDFLSTNGVEVEEVLHKSKSKAPSDKKTQYGLADYKDEQLEVRGGTNYRELLLKLKPKGGAGAGYKSPHWDNGQDVLAHVRFNERTVDGKRILFIEEIQSDWHAAGKEQGYRKSGPPTLPDTWEIQPYTTTKGKPKFAVYDKEQKYDPGVTPRPFAMADTKEKAIVAALEKRPEVGGTPNAPFKGTGWQKLAMKRMTQWAADNGFDELAWTTGSQQAERYHKLAKNVKGIEWSPQNKNLRLRDGGPPDMFGGSGMTQYAKDEAEVTRLLKPELAKQLFAQGPVTTPYVGRPDQTFQNYTLDFPEPLAEINLSSHEQQYDNTMVDFMQKYGKQWGANVSKRDLPVPLKSGRSSQNLSLEYDPDYKTWEVLDENDEVVDGNFRTKKEAQQALKKAKADYLAEEMATKGKTQNEPIWSLPITQALRDHIKKYGQAWMFAPLLVGTAGLDKLNEPR